MFKYALIDLNSTEFFDSEDEARERADEWLSAGIEQAEVAIKDADDETLSRWEQVSDFYYQNDDITDQIRIYKIDTDIFDEELDFRAGLKIMEAGYKDDSGVERIETVYTDIHSLFSDEELENLNDYYKQSSYDDDE